MKKPVNYLLILGLLSPLNIFAQDKYKNMTFAQVVTDLKDGHYKSPGCNESPASRCIPYRDQMEFCTFCSDEEDARNEAHNIAVRNQWLRENASTFKTQAQIDNAQLEKDLKTYRSEYEAALEAFGKTEESNVELDTQLETLAREKEGLEKTQEELKVKMQAIMSSDDFHKRSHEIKDILEDIEDLGKKITKKEEKAKELDTLYSQRAKLLTDSSIKVSQAEELMRYNQDLIDQQRKSDFGAASAIMDEVLLQKNQMINKEARDRVKSKFKRLVRGGEFNDTLLGDFEALKKKNEFTENQGKLFLSLMKEKYDKSVLSQLVQGQIDDSITNKCPQIDQCMKGAISDANSNVNSLQGRIGNGDTSGNSSDK